MQILQTNEVMQLLAKTLKKPMMMINMGEDDSIPEVLKAAPYLADADYWQIITDGKGFLLFEDEADMQHYYKLTVGDDGPTELNGYNGPARVYALTCNAQGELENENT